MKNNFLKLFVKFSFILVAIGLFSSCVKTQKADLVIHNGVIFNQLHSLEQAEAMAVKDGFVLAIGKQHEILNRYDATTYLDLKKKYVYSGFVDAHTYTWQYFMSKYLINGFDYSNELDFQKLENEISNSENDFFYVKNASPAIKEFFYSDSKTFQNKSIAFISANGMHGIANQKMANLIGDSIAATWKKLIPDDILKVQALKNKKVLEAFKVNDYLLFEQELLKQGIFAVANFNLDIDSYLFMKEIEKHHDTKLEYAIYLNVDKTLLEKNLSLEEDQLDANVKIKGFCYTLDGSSGSGNSWEDSSQIDTEKLKELDWICQIVKNSNFQLSVKCFGKQAISSCINVFKKHLEGPNDLRWRIEYFQDFSDENLDDAKNFSILPIFISDKEGLQNFNKVKNNLQPFALGSAFPLNSLCSSVLFVNSNEAQQEGETEINYKVLGIRNALSIKSENNLGNLEQGKIAHFCISSYNIFGQKVDQSDFNKDLKIYYRGEEL